jgi:Ca-activated chloride channel family protein
MNGKAMAAGWFELLGKAVASGLLVSLALAVLALGLATTAQAAPLQAAKINDAKMGTLLFHTGTPGEFAVAPRVETEVAIHVTGIIARTRVTQVFHNPGTEHVEGVYVFPLPEKAAVDHLWVRIGDRVIEGRIQEKEEARRTYEKAKGEGRKAALVEQQRPNLFTNAVANIGPNEMVRVTIEYQQTLAYDNGEYKLRFPLAVTPRYTPAGVALEGMPEEPKAMEARLVAAAPATTMSDAVLHPDYAPEACGAVNPVDIVVMIDAGAPLSKVSSSYHDAMIEKSEAGRTVVYLLKEQEAADRDFELVWAPAPGAAPKAAMFTESKGGTDYALLVVLPPEDSAAEKSQVARMPRETILIVDTSGSMGGAPMEQARAALLMALDTLGPADRFNVIEFNSTAAALFPDALPATPLTLERARDWVKKLQARGGTEMMAALKLALTGKETPGFLRQVIFATDGAVGNEDVLFNFIQANLGGSRLFTVGIGSAPNGHFMTKAAQFGRGTFTYIGDLAEVKQKMAGLFAKIEAPVLKDVAVRWPDGQPVETFPARVPDLYLGEPIVVSAALHKGAQGTGMPKTVIVSGVRGNQPWSVALTPSPSEGESTGVGALWARAKIANLMDALRVGATLEEIRPKVIEVALAHHLVSAYTSLVAVDVTPTAPAATTKTAMVKASAPKGWEPYVGDIPQTDTAMTLQLLLGLLALAAAGMVAVIGRTVPAAGRYA